MKVAYAIGAIAIGQASIGIAAFDNSGTYLCTVSEKASIAGVHLERAGPPTARTDDSPPTRFRMRISPIKGEVMRFRLLEIGYDGADRDATQWQTENSILHAEYRGVGNSFAAIEDQAFLTFGKTRHKNSDGDFEFYHAGFEYPGGEDTMLSARWGRCKKIE